MARQASDAPPLPADVQALFDAQPPERAADCRALAALMQQASGQPPRLWGRMVGFGHHHYVHASGRAGDIFEIGFASGAGGKGELGLYLELASLPDAGAALLARLGRFRQGKGCLYLKRLADVEPAVLAELCALRVAQLRGGGA